MRLPKGDKTRVQIAGMIQGDDFHAARGPDGWNEARPILFLGIHNRGIRKQGERIKMAAFGGDFVSHHTGEPV